MALDPGTRLGPYEIVELCGKGGMGEVYKARDKRLDRDVAIKVLPTELSRDASFRRRFQREAKSISQLQHPHVCTVHDVGSENGVHYLVMEFLEGETLEDRLRRGAAPIEEATRIGREIAEAVSAAHERGVVHRDLKPGNVMLTRSGVKVLDFGLARSAASTDAGADSQAPTKWAITAKGELLGTMPYMSPEQLEGRDVDERSDIWALGCILYELTTGERPFRGETQASLIASIMAREPEPPSRSQPLAPAALDRLVRQSLEKDPKRRWRSARELARALELMELGPAAGSRPKDGERPSVVVLPFANMSSDPEQEYFCDGMAEEVINALTQIEGLHVVARTSAFSFKGRDIDVREIGEKLGVRTVLEGSVRKSDVRLRINAQLINVDDGYHLWSERYDRTIDDVFAVQEDIARAITEQLKVRLVGDSEARPLKVPTPNLDAYRLYLQGRLHAQILSASGLERALQCFEQALALEPSFTLAHAGVSYVQLASGVLGFVAPAPAMVKARGAAERALSLDPDCGDARVSLGMVRFWYEWDWAGAEREFRRAAELSPGSADLHTEYGEFLAIRGRFDESIAAARRGVELDPLSLNSNRILALCLAFAGRLEEAVEQSHRTLALEPSHYRATVMLVWALWPQGRNEEALEVLEAGRNHCDGDLLYESALGATYAKLGRDEEAMSVVEALAHRSRSGDPGPSRQQRLFARGFVHTALGNTVEALEHLEKVVRDREPLSLLIPHLQTLQLARDEGFYGDPRFVDLLRRIEEGGE